MRVTIAAPLERRTAVSPRRVAVSPALVATLAVGALAALGAVLRLHGLGARSVWLDEAFSVFISQRALPETLRLVSQTDVHPPLYYLALHLWLAGGSDEARIRLLSALFSIGSIPLMYLVAAPLYQDRRAGWIAAAILAFSPFHIRYAQEARMYAMLVFFILLSAAGLILALRRRSWIGWVWFAVATALALYTDYGALWYTLALALFGVCSYRRLSGAWAGLGLGLAGAGLLYLPWIPVMYAQARHVTQNFWLPPPSFHNFLETFEDFHSLGFPWLEGTAIYLAGIFVLAYIAPDREGWERSLVSFLLFGPLAISALISLRQPIFLSRNLIAASLGYYLLVAGVISGFRSGKAAALLLLPLLASNFVSLIGRPETEEENWRAAAEFVAGRAEAHPQGLVVFIPGYAELPFDYYFERYRLPLRSLGYPQNELLLHPDSQEPVDAPEAFLAGEPYVWLVLRDAELADPQGSVKQWLDSNGYYRVGDFHTEKLAVIVYFHWEEVTPWSPHPDDAFLVEICASQEGRRLPACPPPMGAPSNVRYHRVNPGETVSWLALRYGSSLEAIVAANGLVDPNRLRVGQELIIPVFEDDS